MFMCFLFIGIFIPQDSLVNSVFNFAVLQGRTNKMLPKTQFSKLIFGHPAGSTKLDRPHFESGEKTPTPQDFSLTRKTARFTKGQFRPY